MRHLLSLFLMTFLATEASAFCGFYVSGSNQKLFNNATQVVLMREGTRTVLSMQNNYKGPPQSFAMVVPVPVILKEENVKTLDRALFDRLDTFDAPRLVEYWEQDPCNPYVDSKPMPKRPSAMSKAKGSGGGAAPKDYGVKIEAEFTVGEYQIVILSAKEATGLDTWLRDNKYNIPEGADAALKPYVEAGMKFFVAKVDTTKVTFDAQENAQLSPLRFHYDTETFALPVRLGLLNSAGEQDIIVHIFGEKRYQVSNYPNVTIPTNLGVAEEVKDNFAGFYAALFDATVAKHPGAVVTEYAWNIPAARVTSGSGPLKACDPCPPVLISQQDLLSLGADQFTSTKHETETLADRNCIPTPTDKNRFIDPFVKPPSKNETVNPFDPLQNITGIKHLYPKPRRTMEYCGEIDSYTQESTTTGAFVLTRLHARYTKDGLGEDLVFSAATPIVGGRESYDASGTLESESAASSSNSFQGRYIIRHAWAGEVNCPNPKRGVWGGPPSGGQSGMTAAKNLAFVARGTSLASMLRQDIPSLSLQAEQTITPPKGQPSSTPPGKPKEAPAATKTEPTATAPAMPDYLPWLAGAAMLLMIYLFVRRK